MALRVAEQQLDDEVASLGARAVQTQLGGHVEGGKLDLVVKARWHLV